jgi:hypothetical protein
MYSRMILKFKRMIQERLQHMCGPKLLTANNVTPIPRLFPTLMQIVSERRRQRRVARIGRLKKRVLRGLTR